MGKYQIALLNVPFDNTYSNAIRFNNREEQANYFLSNSLFANAKNVNFNIDSELSSRVSYRLEDGELLDIMQYNYCIIKDTINNKYYYYFILNSTYDNSKLIFLDIELDVINTFYIDVEFSNCVIDRAHLNRFIEDEEDTTKVKFDTTVNSKLFEREDLQGFAKRVTNRYKLNTIHNINNQNFNDWLKDNVRCWVYVYLKKLSSGYKFVTSNGSSNYNADLPFYIDYVDGDYLNAYSLICYPIMKTDKVLKGGYIDGNTTNYIDFTYQGLECFLENNNGSTIVYMMKMSMLPPFKVGYFTESQTYEENSYHIDNNGDMILWRTNVDGNSLGFWHNMVGGRTSTETACGVLGVRRQVVDENLPILSNEIDLPFEFEFTKNEIINSNSNSKYNPKLLSIDFKAIKLTNYNNYFEYDILKVGESKLRFFINEIFTPDTTRQYVRLFSTNGIYNLITSDNLTGLVGTSDNSIPYSQNQLDTYLANNKNFFLQRDITAATNLTKTAVNAFTTKNVVGGVMGAIDVAVNRIQSNLTLDNMKSAPESLHNANGNALMLTGLTDLAVYVEIHEVLPNELDIANDFMQMYGYTYNQIDNIKNVDNIRHYHNYVKAQLESINILSSNISNTVRNKFKTIFSNGVRFWNSNNTTYNNTTIFNYNNENYERWLNNE